MELGVQDKTAGLVVKITNQSFSFPAYRSDVKLLTAKQAEEGVSERNRRKAAALSAEMATE